MPQFLNSTPLFPSSHPGRLASRNSIDSQLPSLLTYLRLPPQETPSILFQPESELLTLRLAVYRQSARLGAKPLETNDQQFLFQLNTCAHSPYVTSSLTRGWICRLQLLLVLASAVIFGSDSRSTRGHILLSRLKFESYCPVPPPH
jgi:hypothetical protein